MLDEVPEGTPRRRAFHHVRPDRSQPTASAVCLCIAILKRSGPGLALDGGSLSLEAGEIIYTGPTVMMGHATCRADLALGDVMGGRLATGDLGTIDAEGVPNYHWSQTTFCKTWPTRFTRRSGKRSQAHTRLPLPSSTPKSY